MKLTDDIKPVTYMKRRASQLVDEVNEHRRPVVITQNGAARAVILDVASYQALHDAVLMLRLLQQGSSELKSGRGIPQRKVFSDIRKTLRKQHQQ